MTHPDHWSFEWIDHHRRPVVTPNPDFPLGKPVDISSGIGQSCNGDLPYPATGCGLLIVHCSRCEGAVALTTAGRPDDPCWLRVNCRRKS